jgi:hypothetical protein
MQHERGTYGGAAIPSPIRFDCGAGLLATGDWSDMPGLRYYSGGICYRTNFVLPSDARGQWQLDLGNVVASAEAKLNGQSLGIRVSPPWTFDLTPHLRPGDNELEVLVYSALASHYRSIPTDYPGSEKRSGLLGPVKITCTR